MKNNPLRTRPRMREAFAMVKGAQATGKSFICTLFKKVGGYWPEPLTRGILLMTAGLAAAGSAIDQTAAEKLRDGGSLCEVFTACAKKGGEAIKAEAPAFLTNYVTIGLPGAKNVAKIIPALNKV